MNNLLLEVLQWMQNNNYHRASFDRLVGIIPSAATYEQLYALVAEHPMIFRLATIKGGLPGLAVLDDVNIAETLDSITKPVQEEMPLASEPPRVTSDAISNEIVAEHFRNLGGAVKAPPDSTLHNVTICALVLRNGFVIIGKSACVSSDLYNEDVGRTLAREDAMRQIGPYLGFRLADKLRLAA